MMKCLTVLMEELMDGHLLRVKEQGGHVIICVIVAEEATDGRVHLLQNTQSTTELVSFSIQITGHSFNLP